MSLFRPEETRGVQAIVLLQQGPHCHAQSWRSLSHILVSFSLYCFIFGLFLMYFDVIWRAYWDESNLTPRSHSRPPQVVEEGISYLSEFMSDLLHLWFVSNVFLCRLIGPIRRQLCAPLFLCYVQWGFFDGEGYSYLSEFPLVLCHLGLVSNVLWCRLKGLMRREQSDCSFPL